MICPILSQAHRDAEGNASWDHHECIEGSCTFWATEIEDCGLRASGLLVIQRARAALSGANDGDGGPPAGEPLFAAPRLTLDPESMGPLREAMERAASESRDNGLRLLEGVAALEEPIKAGQRELVERLEILRESVASTASAEGRICRIEEQLDTVRRAIEAALEGRGEVVSELRPGLESVNGAVSSLRERVESLPQIQERIEAVGNTVQSLQSGLEAAVDRATEKTLGVVREIPDRIASLERERDDLRALGARFDGLSTRLDEIASEVSLARKVHEEISASLSKEAERRHEDAVRRDREEAFALNIRGVALYYSGATEAAEAAFRAAIRKHPDFSEAHNNLGLSLSRQEKDVEAEASFKRALEIDPDLMEATSNLGFLHHRSGEFEKAVELFSKSTLGAKGSSLAWTNLGNACYQLRRFTQAVTAWKKALDQDPLNESARRALALFQQQGSADAG